MKALVLAAIPVAGRKAGECDHDNQLVDWHCKRDSPSSEGYFTCPTCARLREIAEWCWHEYILADYVISTKEKHPEDVFECMYCKIDVYRKEGDRNPTFTVQSVRALLEDLGEWDKFATIWLWEKSLELDCEHGYHNMITTDSLIVQAATTFLGTLIVKGENVKFMSNVEGENDEAFM